MTGDRNNNNNNTSLYPIGTLINNNEILSIWGTTTPVYILKCGRCGKEFTKTHNKLKFFPPKSCGCLIRAEHERRMKMCFPKRQRFPERPETSGRTEG